jgi:hypothetical protein
VIALPKKPRYTAADVVLAGIRRYGVPHGQVDSGRDWKSLCGIRVEG